MPDLIDDHKQEIPQSDTKMSLHQENFGDRRQPSSAQDDLAGGGGPPYDGGMEARVARLENNLAAIVIDVAVVKANVATKSDIADLRVATKLDIADLRAATKSDIADLREATKTELAALKTAIAEAKTSIVMWVVSAVFIAQLLPSLLKLFMK